MVREFTGLLHLVVSQNRDKSFTFGRSRVRVNSWYIPRAQTYSSRLSDSIAAQRSRFVVQQSKRRSKSCPRSLVVCTKNPVKVGAVGAEEQGLQG